MKLSGEASRLFRMLLLAVVLMQLVACGTDSNGNTVTQQNYFTATDASTSTSTLDSLLDLQSFTNATTATFYTGAAGTFTFTTAINFQGATTFGVSGTLPAGVTLNPATGVLSGTPAIGTQGAYPLVITAINALTGKRVNQNFTLTVNVGKIIVSANHTGFTTGTATTFTVLATGNATPTTFGVTGALPAGVTFNPATGVLSGTPAGGSQGTYPLVFTATNGVANPTSQTFTLTVYAPTPVAPTVNALIVHDGTPGIEADALGSLTTLLTGNGFAVTPSVGVPGGPLGGYNQIWDIRFNNTTPLTAGDMTSYTTYLATGGRLVLIGENAGFATRNITITTFIASLGGETLTLTTPANLQTVQAPFTGPNAVASVTFLAASGTDNPGTGTLLTKGVDNKGAVFFQRGTLPGAPAGMVMAVFDINFLQAGADADSKNLIRNMILVP